MASQFQDPNSRTPIERASFNPIGTVTSAVDSVFGAFNSLLTGAGLSSSSSINQSTKQIDGIIGSGDPNYFAAAGLATNRVSETSLNRLRAGGSPDMPSGEKYSVEVSPQGRIERNTVVEQKGIMDVFPPDLGKHYIQFAFMKYERPVPFKETSVDTEYTVVLPVPSGLVDYVEVNWQPSELGPVGDIADAYARGAGDLATLTETFTQGAGSAALRALGTGALGTLAQQSYGVAPNPNLSMAFRGPTLRSFSFVWTFAPKNRAESEKIQTIVREMKARTLPTMDSGATMLLGYPNMIQPRLYPNAMEFNFKKCVIPRLNVSYSPTGIPSFFKGTSLPTFVQISMNLVEIEYWTGRGDGTSKGKVDAMGLPSAESITEAQQAQAPAQ